MRNLNLYRGNLFELFKENNLKGTSKKSHKCGYILPGGQMYECEPYGHIDLLSKLENDLYSNEIRQWMRDMDKAGISYCFGDKSHLDNYFMCELGWVKVAAYMQQGTTTADDKYDWVVEWVHPMTVAQQNVVYPQ